jgi:hypothetical protein
VSRVQGRALERASIGSAIAVLSRCLRLGPAAPHRWAMSAAAAAPALLRRHTRSAASARGHSVAAAQGEAGGAAAEQRRKRQRKATENAEAAQALDDNDGVGTAVPAAAKRGAGARGKAAAPHALPAPAAAEGPSRQYEQGLWQQGYARVAGVDEAGRGPLAGAQPLKVHRCRSGLAGSPSTLQTCPTHSTRPPLPPPSPALLLISDAQALWWRLLALCRSTSPSAA